MAHRPTIMGTRHMVAACHYLASEAGFKILEAGGNAIDAGVATGIALSVVQPEYVNFAGVAPIIIYSAAEDRVVTIPGLGPWPKAIRPDHFKKHHGGAIPLGILRTLVPAAPDAWITALERFGTMSFGEVAQSAIGYARDGFPVYPLLSEIITEHEAEYGRFRQMSHFICRTGAHRCPVRYSFRRSSRPLFNTWPIKSAPPSIAGAVQRSRPPARRSIEATSRRRS